MAFQMLIKCREFISVDEVIVVLVHRFEYCISCSVVWHSHGCWDQFSFHSQRPSSYKAGMSLGSADFTIFVGVNEVHSLGSGWKIYLRGLDVDGSVDGTTSSSFTSSTTTCGLLPEGTLPQDGATCDDAMPEGTSSIGCTDISYAGLTQTNHSCTCERTDPIWRCTSINTEIEPNQSCPPQDQPKASGDSCTGQLSQPMSSMTCMWSRQVSSNATVPSISCECKRGTAGSSMDGNEVWLCDDTYPTINETTMVPTDTQQRIFQTTFTFADENKDTNIIYVEFTITKDGTKNSSATTTAAVNYFAIMAAVVVVVVVTTIATTS